MHQALELVDLRWVGIDEMADLIKDKDDFILACNVFHQIIQALDAFLFVFDDINFQRLKLFSRFEIIWEINGRILCRLVFSTDVNVVNIFPVLILFFFELFTELFVSTISFQHCLKFKYC